MSTHTDKVKIEIKMDDDKYVIKTPFKRDKTFVQMWRNIPGRRYNKHERANSIPVSEKAALWSLLKTFFGGVYGSAPDGSIFQVPQKKINTQPLLGLEQAGNE
jgi:hypothetical protein